MPGALEEAAKATGGFIDAMRTQPLALAMGLMNIALLVFLFYYLSRITSRTETTVGMLFGAQDKLYSQWAVVLKDQTSLTEKAMHCILPEDVVKLYQVRPSTAAPIAAPAAPEKPQ
jgi:hypothetical protein